MLFHEIEPTAVVQATFLSHVSTVKFSVIPTHTNILKEQPRTHTMSIRLYRPLEKKYTSIGWRIRLMLEEKSLKYETRLIVLSQVCDEDYVPHAHSGTSRAS